MYCLTCAEHTVHALPATLREFPSQSPILRYFQSPRLPGEWWMSKGNKNERKRWMVWVRRWKRAWWTIHYLESLLSGGCHWPYKFMIWKTGKRRHAVMDGMMVNKGVHRLILYLKLALLHTCTYIWHESWVQLWTPSLVKYSSERELEGQASRSCRCYSQHKKSQKVCKKKQPQNGKIWYHNR